MFNIHLKQITEAKSDQMAWKILAICCLKCYLDVLLG